MSRISYYWNRTARTMEWVIAYRNRKTNILEDLNTEFKILSLPKGYWGADPFIFDYEGQTVLFYELFVEKVNKGVISASVFDGKDFSSPKIVLEEPYHLSFPCVFKLAGSYYMIPESGSQYNLVLYKCEKYPYKWNRVKTLIENFDSSDTIVYQEDGNTYVLASKLEGSTCIARNVLFRLNHDQLELERIEEGTICSYEGIRNAGLFFESKGDTIRPGQNCPDGEYGKSTFFWRVENRTSTKESFIRELKVSDLRIQNKKAYSGVHTYNLCDTMEVIDLRFVTRTSTFSRIIRFIGIVIDYIKLKTW